MLLPQHCLAFACFLILRNIDTVKSVNRKSVSHPWLPKAIKPFVELMIGSFESDSEWTSWTRDSRLKQGMVWGLSFCLKSWPLAHATVIVASQIHTDNELRWRRVTRQSSEIDCSFTSKQTPMTLVYKKRLEGVKLTDELLRLWQDCYSKVQFGESRGRKEAAKVLREQGSPHKNPRFIPIDVIKAIHSLLGEEKAVLASLERALQKTSLVFSAAPAPKEETEQQRKFRKRMDRLRLQSEETKYMKLTNNLNTGKDEDDITGRSMTYAASVGLNMVIAPLSFGCFMYFFAGGIFDYFLGESFSSRTTGGTDIKRVIVGVISGVIMLFIEMILFVIRTHEFEAHQRKRQKKKKPMQPFGVYSKRSKKDDSVISQQAILKKQD